MSDLDPHLEELVEEAKSRSVERVVLEIPDATAADAVMLLLQSQVAVMMTRIFDGEELVDFWEDVVACIRNGKSNGTA